MDFDNDKNKFFYKVLINNEINNHIFGQYYKNPINKMKYMQIFDTNIIFMVRIFTLCC